jgi:hypothetical protein
MSSLFSRPTLPSPAPPPPAPPPPPPPIEEDPKVKQAADEERRRQRLRKGRRATILTGPQGLQTEAPLQKKTLLGG